MSALLMDSLTKTHLDTVAEYEVMNGLFASIWSMGRRIDTQWRSVIANGLVQ
jgi:hypothetical protein